MKSRQWRNRIVRDTEQFRGAEAAGKLIRIPTGDGMALIFRDNVEAPLRERAHLTKPLKGFDICSPSQRAQFPSLV